MTYNVHSVGAWRRMQHIYSSTTARLHLFGGNLCLGWAFSVYSRSIQGNTSPNIWMIGWKEFGVIDGGYGGWLLPGLCGSWGTRSYFQMAPTMATNCWRMLYFYLGHRSEILRNILQFITTNGHLALEMLLFLVEGRTHSLVLLYQSVFQFWFPPRLLCSLSWEPFHWLIL